MIVAVIGIAVVAALGGWVVGGVFLRAAGVFTAFCGLLVMIVGPSGTGVVTLIAGSVLWLGGHWHFAFKHHYFKSPLARRIFTQVMPARVDPTRGWTIHPDGHDS